MGAPSSVTTEMPQCARATAGSLRMAVMFLVRLLGWVTDFGEGWCGLAKAEAQQRAMRQRCTGIRSVVSMSVLGAKCSIYLVCHLPDGENSSGSCAGVRWHW